MQLNLVQSLLGYAGIVLNTFAIIFAGGTGFWVYD